MKFRKKPVVIEAEQWQPYLGEALGVVYRPEGLPGRVPQVYDKLHDTWINVEPGDWIITGIQGETYPCKPDVFAATYEPVEGT